MNVALLAQVKLLLGIKNNDSDELLSLLCDNVEAQVKTYCRITDVSGVSLQSIIADMIVNRYRSRGYGKADSPRTVMAVTEGDTKLEFASNTYEAASCILTQSECAALKPYRKLWA